MRPRRIVICYHIPDISRNKAGKITIWHMDGEVQACGNPIANAVELL